MGSLILALNTYENNGAHWAEHERIVKVPGSACITVKYDTKMKLLKHLIQATDVLTTTVFFSSSPDPDAKFHCQGFQEPQTFVQHCVVD